MEQIFIAWGRNKNLAIKVAEKLKEKGYNPIVGGDEKNPKEKDYYLGKEVLNQIKKASKAIILAQQLRPNLMFEFGILFERLNPASIFIFLIGIKRSKFFTEASDLAGIRCFEVPTDKKDIEERANFIVEKFVENLVPTIIDPESLFSKWDDWKNKFNSIKKGEVKESQVVLNQVILHSLQPAYYFGEINFLKDFVSKLELNSSLKTIIQSACEYYMLTELPDARPELGELLPLKEHLDNPISIESTIKNWVELVRNDFLGLVYRRMSESINDKKLKTTYLEKSMEAFMKSKDYLEKIPEKRACWHLWKGYIYRNLGRTYCELNNREKSLEFLKESQKHRREAYSAFKALNVSDIVLNQIFLEIKIVDLDIMRYSTEELEFKKQKLTEIIEALKVQGKLIVRPLILWNKVIVLAKDVAEREANLQGIYRDLEQIENHIRKLKGGS